MKGYSCSIIPDSIRFDRKYAIKSLGAWIGFGTLMTILSFLFGRKDMADEVVRNIFLVTSCAIGTHLIRMLVLSSINLSWKGVYVRTLLIGVPLFALLASLMNIELNIFYDPHRVLHPRHTLAETILGSWFFASILLGGWTGVYLSAIAAERTNKAEVETLRLETALREAELRALKAQINPHFLFNSLNTIRALVNERPDKAQDAVLHLSVLLRAALQSDKQLRPLGEEIDTTKHYLEMERFRFEERLKVKMEIDDNAKDAPVPTMLLQTLVENAVKHGIGRTVDGGEICIRAQKQPDSFLIEVSNPGSLDIPSSGTGVGLKNARMRLTRLLGPGAKLELSEKDSQVTSKVHIPLDAKLS